MVTLIQWRRQKLHAPFLAQLCPELLYTMLGFGLLDNASTMEVVSTYVIAERGGYKIIFEIYI